MTAIASIPPAAEKRILVVDDSREFGAFVRRVAEMAGFVVEVVESASAFREAFPAFQPAIVCLDIVMPMEDGIELVRWLTEQQSKAAIYIVTGHNPSYARAALEIGRSHGLNIAGVLQKPVSLTVLRDILSANGANSATLAAD